MSEKQQQQQLRKRKRKVSEGIAYVQTTFNNTLVSITAPQGDLLCACSAGKMGFKGSRKGTPFAAQQAAETVARKALEVGMKKVIVKVKGPGAGRDSAVRGLRAGGLTISALEDVTPLPHNGCRRRKKRRV